MTETVRFEDVGLWRTNGGARKTILAGVDWSARSGEHWGIIGPNGAGKTTLLRIASAQMRPSEGAAWVLGGRLGRVPLHELRRRVGLVEPALGRRFYPAQRAIDVVLSGLSGTILLADELLPPARSSVHGPRSTRSGRRRLQTSPSRRALRASGRESCSPAA